MQNRADKLFERQLRGEFMNLLIARLAEAIRNWHSKQPARCAIAEAQGQDFTSATRPSKWRLPLGSSGCGAASEWVQNHQPSGRSSLKSLLIQSLASENPELALAEADKQSSGNNITPPYSPSGQVPSRPQPPLELRTCLPEP